MTEETTTKAPTQEQMIANINKQIKLKKLQVELQILNTSMAMQKVLEIEALIKLDNMKPGIPQEDPNLVQHTVTQNDIDTIPEFKAQGFEVGNVIGIPKEVHAQLYPQKQEAQAMNVVED